MTGNALEYFKGNELAANVWQSKYALKRKGEIIEKTPDQMHRRMAKEFARIEKKYKKGISEELIYSLFEGFNKVIPQGSVMSQLGNNEQIGSLSNCVVLPEIKDSYGGIFYADQQLAQLMKRRCGAGLDITPLRDAGSMVSNAAQSSTGAISFMHRFSNTTREVAQDGRRGALMLSLHVKHPESDKFATIKLDLTKVTGANISLKLVNEFMQAVKDNTVYLHSFPVDAQIPDTEEFKDWWENGELNKTTNINGISFKKIHARNLWDIIVNSAHTSAEPGLLFWDTHHYYSPSSLYPEFENISTNPCSEIAMSNDSCRLIAKNMFTHVINPFTSDAVFDFDEWYKTSYNTMRLMDDLVDLELEKISLIIKKIYRDPEPLRIKQVEIDTWEDLAEAGRRGRRTGSGFTAVGDTLAALGLKYDSDEAIKVFNNIMRVKFAAELDSTIQLAEERGAFPAFDASLEEKWSNDNRTMFYMIKHEFPQQWERMQRVGRRNISWSTIAPTGSLSLLAQLSKDFFGTTSGIEPLFSVFHIRRKKINLNDKNSRVDFTDDSGDMWQEFPVFHEGFKMWYKLNPLVNIAGERIALEDINKDDINNLIAMSPYAGSSAEQIDWRKRIEIQAIAQKYITHSISSTINLHKNATKEEISEIYLNSWERGLKGITVYRDGSRSGVLISEPATKGSKLVYHDAPKRPKELTAELSIVSVKGRRYAVAVGFMDKKPYEVFAFDAPKETYTDIVTGEGEIIKIKKGNYSYKSKKGNILASIHEAAIHADEQMLTRLVSGMLRHGVDPKFIIQQIDKSPLEVVSFGKALSRVLSKYIKKEELKEACPECGEKTMIREEGCIKCTSCGHSKCN